MKGTYEVETIQEKLKEALDDTEIFIHIDGTDSKVLLPTSLAGSSNVTLKLSHYFSGKLSLEEDRVVAELIFPEGAFTCEIPYLKIWGLTRMSGETLFWPENAPRDILEEMVRVAAIPQQDPTDKLSSPEKSSSEKPSSPRPALSSIKKLSNEDAPSRKEDKSKKGTPPPSLKPPSLKRIK